MSKNRLPLQLFVSVVIILGVIIGIGTTNDRNLQPKLEAIVEQAEVLSVGQGCVVDAKGALNPDCVAEYREALNAVFTERSGFPAQYAETMQAIYESFDESTDVVLNNQVLRLDVNELHADGKSATMDCEVTLAQTYIPHQQDGQYQVVIAASNEQKTYTFVKGEDGAWYIDSVVSKNFITGTPEELGLANVSCETVFPTREEACAYAASLDLHALLKG